MNETQSNVEDTDSPTKGHILFFHNAGSKSHLIVMSMDAHTPEARQTLLFDLQRVLSLASPRRNAVVLRGSQRCSAQRARNANELKPIADLLG